MIAGFMNSPYPKFHSVIPVLARQSASARRRENGNPDAVPAEAGIYNKETGFLFAQEILDSGSSPE
jgi:hypothetical protein